MTCLGMALELYGAVAAISFVYGQKHAIELECAKTLCTKYSVPHKIVDLSFLGSVVTSALTSGGDVNQPHAYKEGLPASFVPNRNALFLTVAHAHAQEIKADVIVTGVCQTDYSGYPDCRDAFVCALESALNIGYQTQIAISTPLMWLTKAQTFAKAKEFGFLFDVIENSHTCYDGNHITQHEWGYGCGKCPACKLRAAGYQEFISQQ